MTKDIVSVAVIGASFAKAAYLPALRHTEGAEVVAIASARKESAAAVAEEFDVPRAYDDWRAMLEENDVDLVCIATPTDTHADMAIAAVEAGAHVLSEKPMAMDADEAERMLRAAERADRIHMIDHELRFNPNRKHVHDVISSGALGEVRHVDVVNIGNSWSDPAARPKDDWWSLAERGGGRLGANGSHQIDLLRWWFGEVLAVDGIVQTVVADRVAKNTGEPWTATADDLVRFTLQQENCRISDVLLSGVAAHNIGNHVRICGSEGTILISNQDETVLVGRNSGEFRDESRTDPNAGLPGVQPGIWNVSVVSLMRELVGAIREERPLRAGATFADGLATQRVLDAVKVSSAEGRRVDPRA